MLLSINICIHKVLYSTSTDIDSCILSKVQPRSDIISALNKQKERQYRVQEHIWKAMY